jgi:UDP-2,3-diacylglucosamine hydrolase
MPSAGKTLFTSDIHLDSENSVITHSFLDFLENRAKGAEALYVLGDLFEVWVGDDDNSVLNSRVAKAFATLADSGTPVYLMHGNRDFLLGNAYAERCHATLLKEPTIIECHGRRIVLIHGDSLCTRDVEYMKFRRMVRTERWQAEFLEKSLVERHMIAQQARMQSKAHSSLKPSDIMDVTPLEVLNLLQELQVNCLVHGHTHRPAVHTIRLQTPINDKLEAQRIVLGSWDNKGWALELGEDGFDLKYFAHTAI